MNVVVTIPDKFAESFQKRGELSRQMLESFAVESYRRGRIKSGASRRTSEFVRWRS